jgi:hypothetical protein
MSNLECKLTYGHNFGQLTSNTFVSWFENIKITQILYSIYHHFNKDFHGFIM